MYINNDIDYLKFLKRKEIVIFGAGKIGQKGMACLEKMKIIAFCDNDEKSKVNYYVGFQSFPFEN